jgi:uncharacterized protein
MDLLQFKVMTDSGLVNNLSFGIEINHMDIASLFFFSFAFLASGVSTIVGFGSALILISVSSLIFGIKWSIAITTFLYAFNTATKTILFRKHINWKLFFPITLTALPGTIAGSYFLINSASNVIRSILVIIVLFYLALDLLKYEPFFKINRNFLLASGGIYGFLSGAVGTGSIIKAMVFNHIKLEKKQFVATMAATALPLNLCKIVVFTSGALISLSDLPLILGLLIASLSGTFLGKYLLNKLPEHVFYYLVRIMLLAIAIKFLLF